MKFVLDIDVMVDGCRPHGGESGALLGKIARGELTPHCSPELYMDYDTALRRAVRNRELPLTLDEASDLLKSFGGHHVIGIDIDPTSIADLIAEDPELIHVIATARSAKVDTIVTNRPERVKASLKSRAIEVRTPADMI